MVRCSWCVACGGSLIAFIVGWSLFDFVLFGVCCSLGVVRCSLCVVRCSSFVARCMFRVVSCVMFVVCC